MSTDNPERRGIAERLGLVVIEGSLPARWEGRRDGLQVAVECRPVLNQEQPPTGPWKDWQCVWITSVTHPKVPKVITMERRSPRPGQDDLDEEATGDLNFDREIAITDGLAEALARLDPPTRMRLRELLGDQGSWRGGQLTFWRGGRSEREEPVTLGAMIGWATRVVGRFVQYDVTEGLLAVARGDPLVPVRIQAAARLAERAPDRLQEIRRATDGLVDHRLRTPERRQQLLHLLTLPVVQRRITTRLGWKRTHLIDKLTVAVQASPELLPALPEAAWIRLIERLPSRQAELFDLLGEQGRSREALQIARAHARDWWIRGATKTAAKQAVLRLEARLGVDGGQLSLTGEGGEVALAEGGALSEADGDDD